MDVESKTPHQDTDEKQNAGAAPPKAPSNLETNGSVKDSPKQNSKQRRGRSRTPQNKTEDPKTLHITLKKLESELNGKEIQDEAEANEEKGKEKETNNKNEEKSNKEEISNGTDEANKSNTKKEENKKVNTQEKKEATPKKGESKKETPKKDKKDKGKKEKTDKKNELDSETVEMDPLVISDEPDPELQFDDNSDIESGKGSPIISRCVTRRSQTRNIPTPKTPKSLDTDAEIEKTPVTERVDNEVEEPKTDNYDSCESLDNPNASTKPEVGSDLTRMDFIQFDSSELEDSSYINASREKSLSETLRGLSARRSIRPLDDYRMRLLRSNQERSDLNLPYPSRNSVERITTGVKRKDRSATPEERKKFKVDTPGLNSLFASPFANIRNKFKSDLPTSTPKLLSYRGRGQSLYNNEDFETGDDEKKSWCSIM